MTMENQQLILAALPGITYGYMTDVPLAWSDVQAHADGGVTCEGLMPECVDGVLGSCSDAVTEELIFETWATWQRGHSCWITPNLSEVTDRRWTSEASRSGYTLANSSRRRKIVETDAVGSPVAISSPPKRQMDSQLVSERSVWSQRSGRGRD